MTDEELVLVVPRAAAMGSKPWRGINSVGLDEVLALVRREGAFQPRSAMEVDPAFKQVIPYLVLRDRGNYFLMRRTKAGADARLHDRWSIGIGGHLNPSDATLREGLVREWREELAARFVPDFRYVGLLNDDLTDVGRVHLGVVFEADARGRKVRVRETHKLEGGFADPAEVAGISGKLESWSRLTFEYLEAPA